MLAVPKSWKTCFYMSCNMIADLRAFIPAEMKKHQEAFLGGRCQITEQEFFFFLSLDFSHRGGLSQTPQVSRVLVNFTSLSGGSRLLGTLTCG